MHLKTTTAVITAAVCGSLVLGFSGTALAQGPRPEPATQSAVDTSRTDGSGSDSGTAHAGAKAQAARPAGAAAPAKKGTPAKNAEAMTPARNTTDAKSARVGDRLTLLSRLGQSVDASSAVSNAVLDEKVSDKEVADLKAKADTSLDALAEAARNYGSHGTTAAARQNGTTGEHNTAKQDATAGEHGTAKQNGTAGEHNTTKQDGTAGEHGTAKQDGTAGEHGTAKGTDGSAGAAGEGKNLESRMILPVDDAVTPKVTTDADKAAEADRATEADKAADAGKAAPSGVAEASSSLKDKLAALVAHRGREGAEDKADDVAADIVRLQQVVGNTVEADREAHAGAAGEAGKPAGEKGRTEEAGKTDKTAGTEHKTDGTAGTEHKTDGTAGTEHKTDGTAGTEHKDAEDAHKVSEGAAKADGAAGTGHKASEGSDKVSGTDAAKSDGSDRSDRNDQSDRNDRGEQGRDAAQSGKNAEATDGPCGADEHVKE
ncbi:hypothetical protein [Streptomyces sp. HB2AG]|uniref:hypothetical protein n=1 Tax=Streptomyces sp. HB2AG TaxID=2983400 RepID=UPI0022AA41DC|nr:hypothetical protein [Streptomyces sp. HB2AG]MCZ2527659.1 hypothetical protein [Streptomyces sp. HB2AG]